MTVGAPSPLHRWKPAARARTQVLLAALLWTGVGIGLATAGLRWLLQGTRWPVLWVAAAAVAGSVKGRWALAGAARRAAARIARRGDGTCLGGFLSWRTWLLVLGMMGLGALLRRSAVPTGLLGFVYGAAGTALLLGSRVFWAEWRSAR